MLSPSYTVQPLSVDTPVGSHALNMQLNELIEATLKSMFY